MLLMMDAKGVRNMKSILVVVNKQNTARITSCWFIIYYRLVMHGNSNIKYLLLVSAFVTPSSGRPLHYLLKNCMLFNILCAFG